MFYDWNPLYKENFRELAPVEDVHHVVPEPEEGEERQPSHFTKLLAPNIKVLFLRGCGLIDQDVADICKVLETNQTL